MRAEVAVEAGVEFEVGTYLVRDRAGGAVGGIAIAAVLLAATKIHLQLRPTDGRLQYLA